MHFCRTVIMLIREAPRWGDCPFRSPPSRKTAHHSFDNISILFGYSDAIWSNQHIHCYSLGVDTQTPSLAPFTLYATCKQQLIPDILGDDTFVMQLTAVHIVDSAD